MAEITDCVVAHRSKWFAGPYGFVLRNRRPLRFVRWTGALGLRDAPTEKAWIASVQAAESVAAVARARAARVKTRSSNC